MVPPKRIPPARRLRDHKYCRRYTEAGQERHGVLERADVPIIEGEGGHVQKLVSTLDAFHELAQAHHFAVPRKPAHLGLEAREWHMDRAWRSRRLRRPARRCDSTELSQR